jgi:uncharacterized membrane protein YgcG
MRLKKLKKFAIPIALIVGFVVLRSTAFQHHPPTPKPTPVVAQHFVQDDAKMFSASAIAQANAQIASEYARTHQPIYIHTVQTVSGLTADAYPDSHARHVTDIKNYVVKAASADWHTHQNNGIELYIVKSVRRYQCYAAKNLQPIATVTKIEHAFNQSMNANKPDQALLNTVNTASSTIHDALDSKRK